VVVAEKVEAKQQKFSERVSFKRVGCNWKRSTCRGGREDVSGVWTTHGGVRDEN